MPFSRRPGGILRSFQFECTMKENTNDGSYGRYVAAGSVLPERAAHWSLVQLAQSIGGG